MGFMLAIGRVPWMVEDDCRLRWIWTRTLREDTRCLYLSSAWQKEENWLLSRIL